MKYIIWSGFIGSGSSAVGDYLREFKNTFECGKEIRFIKDPYGLSDLKYHLIDKWDFINSVAAINDFLKMSKIWSRYGDGPLCPPGLSYGKAINKNYFKLTLEFINNISSYTFKREFYHTKFQKNYFKYVIDRNRAYLERLSNGKLKIANRHFKDNYLAYPTAEMFSKECKKYINSLFEPHHFSNGKENTILLDLAISPHGVEDLDFFFDDAKMIVVERDPRDMYVEDIEWGININKDAGSEEDGITYSKRIKAMYSHVDRNSTKNILFVRFEDLVTKYDETTEKIRSFVGFVEENHTSKKAFFNPNISIKNIGKWKRYLNNYGPALEAIKKNVPELCYEE